MAILKIGPALTRRHAIGLSALGLAALSTACGGGGDGDEPAADTTSAQVQAFWQAYFAAKTSRNATALASAFGDSVVYEDNSLRLRMAGNNNFIRDQWAGLFAFIPPQPKSVLRWAGGSMSGAAVELSNEAGMFASTAINGLSIVDMRDGKIARITDYWDSADIAETEWIGLQAGFALNPAWSAADTGAHPGTGQATSELAALVGSFAAACSAGDAAAASQLMATNASYQHRPLNLQRQGRTEIATLLSKLLRLLPDGQGMTLTHVVGNGSRGGFEWLASLSPGLPPVRGATAIETASGQITRLSVYYDSRLLSGAQKQAIAKALG